MPEPNPTTGTCIPRLRGDVNAAISLWPWETFPTTCGEGFLSDLRKWHASTGVECDHALAAAILTSDASPRHFGDKHAGFPQLLGRAARQRGRGDCYGYALVATGRAEVMLDLLTNPWDAGAVKPIIEAAAAPTICGGSGLAMPGALRNPVLGALCGTS